jgi:hypothetical protein
MDMPIINLKVQGKQAIGDGTKIVCMNSDYVVQFEFLDCETLLEMPIKKLVIKAGTDYQESPISEVDKDGKTVWQAVLPIFDCRKTVELGVCGKETEDAEPKFTSEPAVFECSKSILCGALVLKSDPKLSRLEVDSNGLYTAAGEGVDGFYEVYVAVSDYISEARTMSLSMATGNQFIYPSKAGALLSEVIITKPTTMVPSNIRKGVDIGGVVGTYETVLTEAEIFSDGIYTAPAGADGFSKVTVNVGSNNLAKILRINDSFTYDYDTSVNITIDVPGIIKYENDGDFIIFTAINRGSCSVVLKDFDASGNVVSTLHYAIIVSAEEGYLKPVEATNVESMRTYLSSGVVGAVIKYIGESDSANGFVQDALYIIEEEDE